MESWKKNPFKSAIKMHKENLCFVSVAYPRADRVSGYFLMGSLLIDSHAIWVLDGNTAQTYLSQRVSIILMKASKDRECDNL